MEYQFKVRWSQDDGEWVGTCTAYDSLSWMASTDVEAMIGIMQLVIDALKDGDTG